MATNDLVLRVPHSLGAAEAQRRIASGVAGATADYGRYLHASKLEWQANRLDFSLVALAQTVHGSVEVEEDYVELRAQLPLLIRLLANRFLPTIENAGQKLLK